ncbi:MAG TPA: hypothetical protein VFB32_07575 [Rudaea sp.]|nr:hypothetical protein [Rudaea sp.]
MSDVNDGDWVVGEPKWWWKYVMPQEAWFWEAVLVARSRAQDPEPSPWLQAVSAKVLEGLAMLNAAARAATSAEASKLKTEAAAMINKAVAAVR